MLECEAGPELEYAVKALEIDAKFIHTGSLSCGDTATLTNLTAATKYIILQMNSSINYVIDQDGRACIICNNVNFTTHPAQGV